MPRMPRKHSAFGYMHVICRGIGKQVLFEEEMDYKYFLKLLKRFSLECNVTLIAYCLMENHVHLLINDFCGHNMAPFMQKIGITYSGYYNRKYVRSSEESGRKCRARSGICGHFPSAKHEEEATQGHQCVRSGAGFRMFGAG